MGSEKRKEFWTEIIVKARAEAKTGGSFSDVYLTGSHLTVDKGEVLTNASEVVELRSNQSCGQPAFHDSDGGSMRHERENFINLCSRTSLK